MPDYSKSKIYKLICANPDLIYIGSTTVNLNDRFYKHKSDWKTNRGYVKSKQLFDVGEVKIELIEEYPCEDKVSLGERERYWIENLNCVNKNLPTRSKKEYMLVNREKKKEYDRQRYLENREKRLEEVKQYYNDNKEKKLAYRRAYHQATGK